MNSMTKFCSIAVLALITQGSVDAAVLTVTDPYFEAPGGFLDVLSQAQSGDTIAFDPAFDGYSVEHYEAITIDKAIHIDASTMQYGLHFSQIFQSFLNPGYLLIDTVGGDETVKVTNARFSGLEMGAPIRVKNSNFVCQSCAIYGNRRVFGAGESTAAIVSMESNVALLSSSFFSNSGNNATLYYGSGDLYLVNTSALENTVDYPYTSALIEGTGVDQLFYVRNSTLVGNFGRVFKMNTEAGSKLNIRHSIVTGNNALNTSTDEIVANIASRGFNILGGISANSVFAGRLSDTVDAYVFDVVEDQDNDGVLTGSDVRSNLGLLEFPYYSLNIEGIALNQGDPLFSPFELLLDYRRIPTAFLVPMISSLIRGDQLGGVQPRVSGGRIDIGAYEMPVSRSTLGIVK